MLLQTAVLAELYILPFKVQSLADIWPKPDFTVLTARCLHHAINTGATQATDVWEEWDHVGMQARLQAWQCCSQTMGMTGQERP